MKKVIDNQSFQRQMLIAIAKTVGISDETLKKIQELSTVEIEDE